MQDIITELFITSSFITVKQPDPTMESKEVFSERDSIDYYTPVLRKYGYNFGDFRYTIESMNSRKSNPMEGILERVVMGIEQESAAAEYKYNLARRFDTLAIRAYTDTLFFSDTLLRGEEALDFRIEIVQNLPPGDYVLQLEYQTMSNYSYPQKSVKYYFVDTSKNRRGAVRPLAVWINRSAKPSSMTQKLIFNEKADQDSLVLFFDQSKVTKTIENYQDTSYITNILITYNPDVVKARLMYHYSLYGEDYFFNRDYLKEPVYGTFRGPYTLFDTSKVRGVVSSLYSSDSLQRGDISKQMTKDVRLNTLKELNKLLERDSIESARLISDIEKWLMVNYKEAADSLIAVNLELSDQLKQEADSLLLSDKKFREDSIQKAKTK